MGDSSAAGGPRTIKASEFKARCLSSPWWNPASHRERRGARLTRREEDAYWAYATDEQRRQAGCIAARMQRGFSPRAVKLMDEVVESGEEIVITKSGRPVSRLAPYRNKPRLHFGRDRDRIRILGDIVAPMPAEWFEKSDNSDKDLF